MWELCGFQIFLNTCVLLNILAHYLRTYFAAPECDGEDLFWCLPNILVMALISGLVDVDNHRMEPTIVQ